MEGLLRRTYSIYETTGRRDAVPKLNVVLVHELFGRCNRILIIDADERFESDEVAIVANEIGPDIPALLTLDQTRALPESLSPGEAEGGAVMSKFYRRKKEKVCTVSDTSKETQFE